MLERIHLALQKLKNNGSNYRIRHSAVRLPWMYEEEAKIGSNYVVDVIIEADLSLASASDELQHTVDYVSVNQIVTEQMAIRSKLLENVAKRIIDQLTLNHPEIVEYGSECFQVDSSYQRQRR